MIHTSVNEKTKESTNGVVFISLFFHVFVRKKNNIKLNPLMNSIFKKLLVAQKFTST